MARKRPTKADLRQQLEQETRRYLARGGEVQKVPRGASGADPLKLPRSQWSRLFAQPKGSRTLVPEVVAAIEARRQKLHWKPPRKRSRPRPRRKVLYDDFGEPIRRVWVDD